MTGRAASVSPKSPGNQPAAVMDVRGTPRIRKPPIRLQERNISVRDTLGWVAHLLSTQRCTHANILEHKTTQRDVHTMKKKKKSQQAKAEQQIYVSRGAVVR